MAYNQSLWILKASDSRATSDSAKVGEKWARQSTLQVRRHESGRISGPGDDTRKLNDHIPHTKLYTIQRCALYTRRARRKRYNITHRLAVRSAPLRSECGRLALSLLSTVARGASDGARRPSRRAIVERWDHRRGVGACVGGRLCRRRHPTPAL